MPTYAHSNTARQRSGLRLLSFDAGGSRGVSQLKILAEMMDRLNFEAINDDLDRPCAVFDMIGGVGSGGFVAILLVIFGLSAEEALDEFIDLSVTVLSKHDLDAKARTEILRARVSNLIDKYKMSQEMRLLDPSDRSQGCKLAVPISYKQHLGSNFILRNHTIRKEQAVNLTIADALLATVATPPLFETFSVSQEEFALEYMGADWILSNPTQEIIAEAYGTYEPQERVACLLSIGCGHAGIFALSDHNQSSNLTQIIANIAMDADRKAQSLGLQMGPSLYYRFSVTSGLEKESKISLDPSVIITHTEVYLNDKPISDKMDMCINSLTIREGVSTLYQLKHPGSQTASSILLPPLTNAFVMRKDAWEFISMNLLERNRPYNANEPRILVVTGIGGCGKTQLMLKFMTEHEGRFAYRFFIDGSSEDRIREGIVRNVRTLRNQYSHKGFEDCLAFLSQSSNDGIGLLVYDNVDDPAMDLSSLLPRGSQCAIAITSRNRILGDLCPESHLILDVMSMEEAIELLLHRRVTITNQVRKDAEVLAHTLGCLPIALQQAHSYMQQTKCSIKAYLERLSSSRDKLLGQEIKHQVNLKAISTYATFETSFIRLSTHVQKFLRLLAYFHWGNFPTELVILAAKHHFSDYESVRLEYGDGFHIGKKMLESIFHRSGEWDITDLDEAILSLQSYSLVTAFPGVDTLLLRIHPLVHEWLRSTTKGEQHEYQSAAILLLALGSRDSDKVHNAAMQYLASHVIHMSSLWDDLHVNDAVAFGYILHMNGLYQAASGLRAMVVRELRKSTVSDNIKLSDSIWELAVTYHGLGRRNDARSHQEEVLKLRNAVLGKDHPKTIKVSSTLAVTYYELGLLQEAMILQKEVLELSKKILGDQHSQTISISTQLGHTYRKLGKLQLAKDHQEEVLRLTRTVLGERHPETIDAKNNLALTYRDLWWLNKSEALQSDVLNLREELQGERHPQTVTARHNLANTYRKLGRLKEAEELQEKVLKQRKEILGERHPGTISAIYNLANTYRTLGLLDKAEKLQEEILVMRKEILGESHPNTLKVYHCLALTYHIIGKLNKALEIQEKALRASKEVVGEQHTDTICATMNLASTYCQLERLDEAMILQEGGLGLSKDILGEQHPIVLLVSNNLALIYHRLRRLEDAKLLQENVFKSRCELLGARHPDTLVASSNLQAIYHDLGRTEEAEKTQRETLILMRKILGSRHFHTTGAMLVLAKIMLSLQRKNEALELLTEANDIISEMLEVAHPQYVECQRLRACLQSGENQLGLVGDQRGSKDPSTTPQVDDSLLQVKPNWLAKFTFKKNFFKTRE